MQSPLHEHGTVPDPEPWGAELQEGGSHRSSHGARSVWAPVLAQQEGSTPQLGASGTKLLYTHSGVYEVIEAMLLRGSNFPLKLKFSCSDHF